MFSGLTHRFKAITLERLEFVENTLTSLCDRMVQAHTAVTDLIATVSEHKAVLAKLIEENNILANAVLQNQEVLQILDKRTRLVVDEPKKGSKPSGPN